MQFSAELEADDVSGVHIVRRVLANEIWINDTAYRRSIALHPQGVLPWQWPSDGRSALVWDDIPAAAISAMPQLEIILVGLSPSALALACTQTSKQRYLMQSALQAQCAQKRIGVEVMRLDSAARTYNILAGDGRFVLALLWLGDSDSAVVAESLTPKRSTCAV